MIEFKLILIYSAKFSHIVTNALLFIDFSIPSVLNLWCDSNEYLKKIEEAVVSVVSLALKTRQ
jgi:hypothetical protein